MVRVNNILIIVNAGWVANRLGLLSNGPGNGGRLQFAREILAELRLLAISR